MCIRYIYSSSLTSNPQEIESWDDIPRSRKDMRNSVLGVNEGGGETGRLEKSAAEGWGENGQDLLATVRT